MILDGKTLADASTQDEMLDMERARKQEAMSQFTQMARQAAQEQAAQQAAQDPLNAIQRQIAYNLVGAKQAYKDALANGDTEGMAAAHGAADSFRNQGNAIGWNGDGYGSDVSLEQAAQNLANNDARALANIFYNQQNADDHYTMEIANLLDKGYSIDSAKRMAAQSADRLDRKNNAELIDSFATYGLDPRGVLTNNGVRILGELAQNGNSELANFYANMYAKPINEYDYQNQIAKMGITQRDLLERMAKQNDYATQARQENFANAEKMAILNNSLGLNREIQLMQARIAAGVMQKDAAHQWLVNKYMAAGLDEQSANIAALTSLNGGKGKGSRLDSTQVKHLEEELKAARADYNTWRDMNQDKDPSAYPGYARLQQLEAMSNSILGFSNGGDSGNVYSQIANDYDKFRDFYQKALDDAADDPSVTYADIIAHAERVNKEFADNFFDDSYRNAKRPGADTQPKQVQRTPEPPKQSAKSSNISSNYNNGQQIVVPKDVQKQIAENIGAVWDEAVHGTVPVPRGYQGRVPH